LPGYINVSGAQKLIASPQVKVSGVWKSVSVAYVNVSGTWKQWYAAQIIDTFDRANSGSLGTTSNGVATWTNLTGTWGITSNQATTSSYGSYPVAQVNSPTNQADFVENIDIVNGAGGGVALWITDTNNWYAVVSNTIQNTNISCSQGSYNAGTGQCVYTYTIPASCTQTYLGPADIYYYATKTTTSTTITAGLCADVAGRASCTNGGGSCHGTDCWYTTSSTVCDSLNTVANVNFGCGIAGYDCTIYAYGQNSNCAGASTGSSCYQVNQVAASTGTGTVAPTITYSYSYQVNLLRKNAGTVSTLQSYGLSYEPRSLTVTTSNNTVKIDAYSATGQTGTVTSNTATVTSPTRTSGAGIIIGPSSYTQTTALDNFSIK